MKEYIIEVLIEEFGFSISEAFDFYNKIVNRQMLENFIKNINNFNTKEQLIKAFIGDD